MNMYEETMKSTKVFEGKVISVRVDTVELPGAKYAKREIVEHRGAAAILAVDENENIYMVRQYRKACEEVLLEIPAGKLEIGEKPLDCAKRELREEVGIVADNMDYMLEFYTSAGFCNEKIHVFLAKGITPAQRDPDEDEIIEVEKFSIDEVLKKITYGEIVDAKTIIAILYYVNNRRQNGI